MADGHAGVCAWVLCGVALGSMWGGPWLQQHAPTPWPPVPACVGQTQKGGQEIRVKNECVALRGLH